jgi:hypothetical protein
LKLREEFPAFRVLVDSDGSMIRGGFLSAQDRGTLIALARDGSAASRLTRRANALVLLDDGWSCQEVADALLLNDDTTATGVTWTGYIKECARFWHHPRTPAAWHWWLRDQLTLAVACGRENFKQLGAGEWEH